MTRIFLAFSAALALAACAPATVVSIPAPVEFAGRTAADEQVAIGIEQGYKAFRLALELGVDTGVLVGARAKVAADADLRAYRAVLVAREAYKTANAENYLNAARSANAVIAGAIAVVRNR